MQRYKQYVAEQKYIDAILAKYNTSDTGKLEVAEVCTLLHDLHDGLLPGYPMLHTTKASLRGEELDEEAHALLAEVRVTSCGLATRVAPSPSSPLRPARAACPLLSQTNASRACPLRHSLI